MKFYKEIRSVALRIILYGIFECRHNYFAFFWGGGGRGVGGLANVCQHKIVNINQFQIINENKYKIFQSIILLSTCHPVNFGAI